MRVLIFGASGMIGHGALLEALDDPRVTAVRSVGRRAVAVEHAKLTQVTHGDFTDLSPIERELAPFDACLYCLGVSSAGMSKEAYRAITVDTTASVSKSLTRVNASMVMCFISGAGTSATSGQQWARDKHEAEEIVRRAPFARAHCFRPAYIQPMRGVTSTIASYRALYAVTTPLYPLLRHMPSVVTSTVELGRAMLVAAREGGPAIVENRDLPALAARARS